MSVAKKAVRSVKFPFKREWYQPLAWMLDNLEWSSMYFAADKMPDKRKNSVSYVELACIADVLRGGPIGPRRATFAEKAAIVEEGVAQLAKKTVVADDDDSNQVASERFVYQLPNVPSASSTGFTASPGLSRRPILGKFPGLHTAVGALLSFAKNVEKVLDAVMPRYTWTKPSWKEDSLLTTWEQIMARRAGEQPQGDNITPNLQPFQLQPVNQKLDGSKEPNKPNRRTALTGPCTFGCRETKERSRGKPVWRRVPCPSPWSTVPAGATLCRKCYDRAMVIIRRGQHREDQGSQERPGGNVHAAESLHTETKEGCLATEQGTPSNVMNNSQPCTRVSRSVHEDDEVVNKNPSKRRRVEQGIREEDQGVNSEPNSGSNSRYVYSSEPRGVVDVRPFCTTGLNECKSFLQEPDKQGLADVRPVCTAALDKSVSEKFKGAESSTGGKKPAESNITSNVGGTVDDVNGQSGAKRPTCAVKMRLEFSGTGEKLDVQNSRFNSSIESERDTNDAGNKRQKGGESLFGIITAKKKRWMDSSDGDSYRCPHSQPSGELSMTGYERSLIPKSTDIDSGGGHESQSPLSEGHVVGKSSASFEDREYTRAKRGRWELQKLASGACSSSGSMNPELVSGCKGIARETVGLDGQPQGTIILGDGGLRPPEPLQPETVHAPASPVCPGLAMGKRVPPAMQPQMVSVHEAGPTGEGKA